MEEDDTLDAEEHCEALCAPEVLRETAEVQTVDDVGQDEAIVLSGPTHTNKKRRFASRALFGTLKAGAWMMAGSALTVAGLYRLGADDF